jgi:SRSO17 transposase
MDLDDETGAQGRFEKYTASLAAVLGHTDRVRPFADYCIGLLSAEGRKSVEPLAAVTAPERTAAQHQSLLHFVAQAPWSGRAMLRRVRDMFYHPSRVTSRSRRGSSTTLVFLIKAATRSAWPGSIAVSWASRTTARSR